MNFPTGIIGPKFSEGDLVSFSFDDAELTLTALKIPCNNHGANRITHERDFRNVDVRDWETNDQDQPCLELLLQRFCFEDARTLDDIAQCQIFIGIVEARKSDREANVFLSPDKFQTSMIAGHDYSSHESHMEKYELDKTWPALPNRYNGRTVPRKHLDWFVMELNLSLQPLPVQLVMIPINSRFALMAYIDLQSLHYAGRTNPYSNELLKQFEKDLFEELLNNIQIQYSPELINQINALNADSETSSCLQPCSNEPGAFRK